MHELPKASAWLHQAEMTLEAYAERRPGSMPAPSGTDAAISGDATPTSPSPASAEKASALTTPTSESLT